MLLYIIIRNIIIVGLQSFVWCPVVNMKLPSL